MLAIYERFEMPYKAFELIDTIDMNLMNIFPGSISNENIDFIIQLLEFLGEITERLSKKIYSNDYHLFQQSQQNESAEYHMYDSKIKIPHQQSR